MLCKHIYIYLCVCIQLNVPSNVLCIFKHKMHISFLNPSCNRCYLLFDLKVDLFFSNTFGWLIWFIQRFVLTQLYRFVSCYCRFIRTYRTNDSPIYFCFFYFQAQRRSRKIYVFLCLFKKKYQFEVIAFCLPVGKVFFLSRIYTSV